MLPISADGMCEAIASTGTRLRFASNRPLMKCRLPGPHEPATTASSPFSSASAPAANAAASSWRMCIHWSASLPLSRRSASVKALSESPGRPHTRVTPARLRVSMKKSATFAMIRRYAPWALCA